jgi:hypothetical protein
MSKRRRRGRPALWDPSRDDPDYFALLIMLEVAVKKPIKPYALARVALAHVRKMAVLVAVLDEDGYFYELKAKVEGADEETLERWKQTGKEVARRKVFYPYQTYNDKLHINRLRNKFQKLLGLAEASLFFKDFPDGNVDDFAGYCRTVAEKQQEALRIINWLWNERLERLVANELA